MDPENGLCKTFHGFSPETSLCRREEGRTRPGKVNSYASAAAASASPPRALHWVAPQGMLH